MAEILSIASIVSFVIAGISFAVGVALWFVFDIPAVINDLSHRKTRKAVAKLRAANEKTGQKSYQSSEVNVKRGKLTDTMHNSANLSTGKKADDNARPETGLLAENRAKSVNIQQTAPLIAEEKTGLLVDEEETMSLADIQTQQSVKRAGGKKLVMLDEVLLIHTDEECL